MSRQDRRVTDQQPMAENPEQPLTILAHRAWADALDQRFRMFEAAMTGGVSPISGRLALMDWAMNLAGAPGTAAALAHDGVQRWLAWAQASAMSPWTLGLKLAGAHGTSASVESARVESSPAAGISEGSRDGAPQQAHVSPRAGDRRFAAEGWGESPFREVVHATLLIEAWADACITETPSLQPRSRAMMRFLTGQLLDLLSPTNVFWLNPEVLFRTRQTLGMNLIEGQSRFVQDMLHAVRRQAGGAPSAHAETGFVVGRDVAATPGEVVFRNDLFELIHYAPTTTQVRAEPVLIVPAWIMKYYVLDLSPHNSLVRWLVGQGFGVFCISWRNPGQAMSDVGLDDYRTQGVLPALDAVLAITGAKRAHACGYCLGGTLLAITAAAMAREGDNRLASLTLLAAQTDFSEAGGLSLFIDESQLAFTEATMRRQGFLDGTQMADAFVALNTRDLLWSRLVRSYWLVEDEPVSDLMAWNADVTRMPARMHGEYLRWLFLENRLATGGYVCDGQPISLRDLACPLFVVGTETDHVAPWRSVFKLHQLTDAAITFLLTAGGHNAGVVSEPGRKRRHYRIGARGQDGPTMSPDQWLRQAALHEGSWWPAWADWLRARSSQNAPARAPGAEPCFPALAPAPGTYVHER
jgi:polyhydroxyalkanoate synthase